MTGCGAPRHDGQDEVETEAHAALCRPCRLGLLWDLRRLPGLHADLEQLPATGDGDGTGLPFSEPASDCRSQIRHDLTYWARHITHLRGLDAPPVLERGWSTRPVLVLAGWLAGQVTWCSFRDWAPDMAGAIGADRARAQALLDPYVKRVFDIPGELGICLHCEARVSVTVYASEGDRRRSFIACPGCGSRWEPEQWMSYGRQVIRRRKALASLAMVACHTGHCGRLGNSRRLGPVVCRQQGHHPPLGVRGRLAGPRRPSEGLPLGRCAGELRETTRESCAAASSVTLDKLITSAPYSQKKCP